MYSLFSILLMYNYNVSQCFFQGSTYIYIVWTQRIINHLKLKEMTVKIDGLYILVDFKSKYVYPRIFMSKESAEECNKILGGYFEIKDAFINN